MASILIMIEPYDRYLWHTHLIRLLGRRWVEAGHRVQVGLGTGKLPPAADLAILHIDRTVVPQPYLEAIKRYPATVNGTVADIRKRAYSRLLLARGDDYTGPVIVKSDFNSGGKPEQGKRNIARRKGRLSGPQERASAEYRVYESLGEVPAGVWQDPGLVVEKFLPEREGDDYFLHYCYFLGDAEFALRLRSRSPVVKGANTIEVREVPPPPELRALRRQMGFGYGKFDYAMREGRVVLFDANRTPSISMLLRFGLCERVVNHLAGGLKSVLPAA